ncbi:MAG TPA: protein kinase [Gemmataceae bacterium]|nr:protein kinase [Gemmataceae bacterium]
MSTAFAACGEYAAALFDSGLVGPDERRRLAEFLQKTPAAGPKELSSFLVQHGMLTRFQAEYVLEGRVDQLTLASFQLIDVIGVGSMGPVYKAKSKKDGGWYAVKIVPRRNVMNLGTVAEKVKALKRVRHPRVSALVNIGASGDKIYLVWPYLEGGQRLDDLLKKHGKFPPRQSAQIALQAASGLLPYHEQGLFHGLLKPTDVLIGADRRVRVLDFGVGFLLTSERGKSILDTMTNGKKLAKGLDCASPESILDSLARTPAGDQYSLGCILYRCLTGQYPFPYDNPVKKMLAHQNEYPEPIRDLSPETPAPLADVVDRLMEKAPEDRYGSIAEAIKELQAITTNARAFTGATPKSKPFIGPAAPAAVEPPPERLEKQEAPASQNGNTAWLWILLACLAAGCAIGWMSWWMMQQ